jgi:hypothetical protein
VKKYCSQELFGKLALPGIIIGLFTITAFTPDINSGIAANSGQNNISFTFTNQTVQPVFSGGVEFVNLTEPVVGSISKVSPSFSNVIPLYLNTSGFHTNNQYPGNYIIFSDKIPRKSFRQICLFLDLPPPVLL